MDKTIKEKIVCNVKLEDAKESEFFQKLMKDIREKREDTLMDEETLKRNRDWSYLSTKVVGHEV